MLECTLLGDHKLTCEIRIFIFTCFLIIDTVRHSCLKHKLWVQIPQIQISTLPLSGHIDFEKLANFFCISFLSVKWVGLLKGLNRRICRKVLKNCMAKKTCILKG